MCEGTLTSVGLVREKCYFFFFPSPPDLKWSHEDVTSVRFVVRLLSSFYVQLVHTSVCVYSMWAIV